MGQEVLDKVDQYIQALADGLGVAASHVYETLVVQQIISGWVNIGIMSALLLVILGLITLVYKGWKKGWDEEGMGVATAIVTIISIIVIVSSIFVISSGIKHIINPEYYAIQELLEVFK